METTRTKQAIENDMRDEMIATVKLFIKDGMDPASAVFLVFGPEKAQEFTEKLTRIRQERAALQEEAEAMGWDD